MTEVADLVPKGSCDLIKLSWEETEAEAHCALKSGKRYYRLVTMETATSANNCHQLDQSADHLLVTKMGAVLGLKGGRQERDSRPVTGENMWVLGGVLLINRDYTGIREGENTTNWACHGQWQSS